MTPFGVYLRRERDKRGLLLKDMAEAIGVSPSYLSALERGKRGKPSFVTLQRLVEYLGLIWDDAEDFLALAGLSAPSPKLRSGTLPASRVLLANRLARDLALLTDDDVSAMHLILDQAVARGRGQP